MTDVNLKNNNRMSYLITAGLILFSIISYGIINESSSVALVLLLNIFLYFLVISLYFGISLLAYHQKNNLLWGSAIAAFVVGYIFSGMDNLWNLITGLSMLLFAATIAGRLSYKKIPQQKVYILSSLAIIIFSLGMYSPIWSDLMKVASDWVVVFLEDAKENLITMGYSTEAVIDSVNNSRKAMALAVHLIPSMLVLSSLMQFSIGYMIFLYYLDKKYPSEKRLSPFIYWKMPFLFIPVVAIVLVIRYLSSESMALTADNIIAFLSVFYSITGLALMEFYLRKFKFSKFMRIFFYFSLFLTQFVGFFVAAILGFIDSFTDWRKVQQLSFEEE